METSSELYALPVRISDMRASTSTGSHLMATSSYAPRVTFTVLSASSFFARISGIAISAALRAKSGMSSPAKEAMSFGLLTSLNIVSTTTAALRTMLTLPFTRSPRSSTGMMMERVGSSTAET